MRSPCMKTRLMVVSCAALIAVGAEAAQASCVPSTDKDSRARAGAAFVGRVLSVNSETGAAKFRIRRVIKGSLQKGAKIRVVPWPHPSSITLEWDPEVGERWRVYTVKRGRRWITSDCMGTRQTS